MENQVNASCDQCASRSACPDCLIDYIPKFREYVILVHDGGTSGVGISFCPWCGQALPESERDRWFAALEARGIEPWSDEMPDDFRDERWLATN